MRCNACNCMSTCCNALGAHAIIVLCGAVQQNLAYQSFLGGALSPIIGANQSGFIATSRLNCYIIKPLDSLRRTDQIRLSEEPCLEMLTEWRQRLSWRRLLWQGVPDAWRSNRESPATDGWEPDECTTRRLVPAERSVRRPCRLATGIILVLL